MESGQGKIDDNERKKKTNFHNRLNSINSKNQWVTSLKSLATETYRNIPKVSSEMKPF